MLFLSLPTSRVCYLSHGEHKLDRVIKQTTTVTPFKIEYLTIININNFS